MLHAKCIAKPDSDEVKTKEEPNGEGGDFTNVVVLRKIRHLCDRHKIHAKMTTTSFFTTSDQKLQKHLRKQQKYS